MSVVDETGVAFEAVEIGLNVADHTHEQHCLKLLQTEVLQVTKPNGSAALQGREAAFVSVLQVLLLVGEGAGLEVDRFGPVLDPPVFDRLLGGLGDVSLVKLLQVEFFAVLLNEGEDFFL